MILKSKLLIISAAVVAMSAGFWLSTVQQSNSENSTDNTQEAVLADVRMSYSPIQGTILSPARKIAIPALLKDNGKPFTIDDLTGHWTLFFFGYTHCPDICPVTMGVLAQAKKITIANQQQFPKVVFVSVDPERDKLEMLGEYVKYFDKDFIGVTGEEKLLKALMLQMSVVYMKMPSVGSSSDYLVDHSSALLLLNTEGKLAAFLSPPHEAKTILKDFQTIVDINN